MPHSARTRIMDETARLLVSRGYAATSLRDIAQAAGMQAASLYHHFSGKDALIDAVLTEGVARFDRAMDDALASDVPPVDRLRAAMRAHMQVLHDGRDYASAHIRAYPHVPPDIRTRLRAAREAYDARWAALIDAASGDLRPGMDARLLRFTIFGAMNWTLEWRADRPPEALADAFHRLIFDGARP